MINPVNIWVVRLGLVLALSASWIVLYDQDSTAAFGSLGVDPDRRFVDETQLPVGRLSFEVLEETTGIHLPSRLFFAHADGRTDKPIVGRFKQILVTASGQELKTIPVGEYDVYITRGTEYSLDHQKISITEGKLTHFTSTLSRAIDTSGFISSDFHLHLQFAMRDGAMVAAAEGLDLLTATDHNVLKDYAPYIDQLNLGRFMTSVVGAEVDTAFGHYNSFPMSVNRWENREFRYAIRTPGEMLRMLRADPGEEIVQINHPRRWEPSPRSGYFDGRMNPETSKIEYPFFENGFDQVEIYNALTDAKNTGPEPPEGERPKPEDLHYGRTDLVNQKLKDWYSLLNRGILMTGVSNTDAHIYPEHLPAYPRNYVLSDTDDPWKIDPLKIVSALKQRASTASCGPFIRFTANDGAQVGSIISDDDNAVTLRLHVEAAPWIPVDLVEVIANGKVIAKFTINPKAVAPVRFVRELLDRPTQDTWYLVIVTSDRRWPEPFTNFSSFSFTNPILVDVNGNGHFDPPNPGYAVSPDEMTEEERSKAKTG
jgi:hypothetical protein